MAIAGFGGVRPPDLGDRRPTGLTGTAAPRTKPAGAPAPLPTAPAGSSFAPLPVDRTITQWGPSKEFGQPLRPGSFNRTAGISIYDPDRRGGGWEPRHPWEEPRKGEPGFGGTPAPTPTEAAPTTEPEPQTFFERFPTPQDAWQDWIARMGQFLARDPSETPNFPGPWGNVGGSGAAGAPGLTTEERLRELLGDSPGTDEIIRKMEERGKGTFYGIQAN